jgi:hypothetical protein
LSNTPFKNLKDSNWKDDLVTLINSIIEAETDSSREDAVEELLDGVEDLVIMSYIKGRQNGMLLLSDNGPEYEEDTE